ncbi:MAG TPA: NAD-dependent epimerase/dehydratase family protein, partial [Thermoanaerobaculia bacterium]|nr:NAD-dependent epimerase/dehydratase family protein [Thermoanaerobaculia bacterium]
MKVAISGGTGFIGSAVVQRLRDRGDEVAMLRRGEAQIGDVNINLAGENIGTRWTRERKRRVLDSRVTTTNAIVAAHPRVLINASAVGFYGPRGDEILDESSPGGAGFLADVTRQWEEAAHRADGFARVVIFRFGVVLAASGGALQQMMLPFRFCAGGPIGSGRQWMSWIDRQDVVRAIEWA